MLNRIALLLVGLGLVVFASACGGGSDVPEEAVAVVDGTEISAPSSTSWSRARRRPTRRRTRSSRRSGLPSTRACRRSTSRSSSSGRSSRRRRPSSDSRSPRRTWTRKSRSSSRVATPAIESGREGPRRAGLHRRRVPGDDSHLAPRAEALRRGDEGSEGRGARDRRVLPAEPADAVRNARDARVRHILISEKNGDKVDFPKSKAEAERIYALLTNGGDFEALAKENSADPGSKDTGGKLTITRGQTVPEFDKTAFDLKEGACLPAGQDDVRLPRDRGALPGARVQDDASRQGPSVDQGHASPGEEDDVHDGLGRGLDREVRGQGQLRSRFRAARGPGRDVHETETETDPSPKPVSPACPFWTLPAACYRVYAPPGVCTGRSVASQTSRKRFDLEPLKLRRECPGIESRRR